MLRVNDYILAKEVYMSKVISKRRMCKPKWRWVDGVKTLLIAKGISRNEGKRLINT